MTLDTSITRHINQLIRALEMLDQPIIMQVVDLLMRAWFDKHNIFIIGNGGSASTASHMGNDFAKLVVKGQPRFRAMSLTDNVSLLTAWANDNAYEHTFAEQLRNLCQPNDILIAISCSGNSPNILNAVNVAHEFGATVIAFTGNDGGRLAGMADWCIKAEVDYIGQQEDIHLVLDHLITRLLRKWIEDIAAQSARPPRALILAAGEGSRLLPLTLTRPKPMLPIDGKPLLEHIISWLRHYGISEQGINLHHCPQVIMDHFGNGDAQQVRIVYSQEDTILGTAGAARKLGDFLGTGTFIVVYGDVLTNLDLASLLRYHYARVAQNPATGVTLSLYRVPNPTEVGLVGMDGYGRINRFVEKPKAEEVFTNLANAGVMIVEPHVLEQIPPDTFCDFGLHLLPMLLAAGVPMYGWVVPFGTYLLDIGSPEKYEQAQREWALHGRAFAK